MFFFTFIYLLIHLFINSTKLKYYTENSTIKQKKTIKVALTCMSDTTR